MCNVKWRACCRSYPPWCTAPHFLCFLQCSLDHLLHKFISQSHTKTFTERSIVFHDRRNGVGLCLWMDGEKSEDLEGFGRIETLDQLSNMEALWADGRLRQCWTNIGSSEFLIRTFQSVSWRTVLQTGFITKKKPKTQNKNRKQNKTKAPLCS